MEESRLVLNKVLTNANFHYFQLLNEYPHFRSLFARANSQTDLVKLLAWCTLKKKSTIAGRLLKK